MTADPDMNSALYAGIVVHQRSRPRAHRLRYRVFSLLLDLDEAAAFAKRSWLFGFNRRGLFSFRESDHGAGEPAGLRAWVDARLAAAGIDIAGGRVTLLCYPRILGYVFNPLSVYFCHAADGGLRAILYEVANTYGERHTYVIPVVTPEGVVRQAAAKVFYVSPFLPVSGRYRFRIAPPTGTVAVTISVEDEEGIVLTASFTGRRKPLTDATLARAFLAYPLMTLKIMGGIHWEALKIWRKGIRFRPHVPAAERIAASVVAADAPPLPLGAARPRGEEAA